MSAAWTHSCASYLSTKLSSTRAPLYSKPPADEIERASQTKKPKTPVRQTVTGQHPFLRLIGRNNLDEVQPWIDQWSEVIANWLRDGLDPYISRMPLMTALAPKFGATLA